MEMILRLAAAAVVAVAVGGGQFLAWLSVVRLTPGDAQGAIAVVFAALSAALSGLAVFVLAAVGLWAAARRRWNLAGLLATLLAAVVALVGLDVRRGVTLRHALEDAADPATPVERLRELAMGPRGFGYEVDNRLAANPTTPADLLRALHGRPDQIGTELCLAANPHTPDDVLRALAVRDDEWSDLIRRTLRGNPRAAGLVPDVSGGGESPSAAPPAASIPVEAPAP